jgi:hypothetical protein
MKTPTNCGFARIGNDMENLTVKLSPKSAAILTDSAPWDQYPGTCDHRAPSIIAAIAGFPAKTDIELTPVEQWALAQWCGAYVADKSTSNGDKSSIRGSILRRVDPDGELRVCEPPKSDDSDGPTVEINGPSTDGPANAAESTDNGGSTDQTTETEIDLSDPTIAAEIAAKPAKRKREPKRALVPVEPIPGALVATVTDDPKNRPSLTTLSRLQACLNAATALIRNPDYGKTDGAPMFLRLDAIENPENVDPTDVLWCLTPPALRATMDDLVEREKSAGNANSGPITAWYTRAGGHWRSGRSQIQRNRDFLAFAGGNGRIGRNRPGNGGRKCRRNARNDRRGDRQPGDRRGNGDRRGDRRAETGR